MENFINILIAEDDKDDYLSFEKGLQKLSSKYNISHARNGLECITFLKTQPKPDLIFLDLNMPLKTGLDCLKFIKDREELKDIPVIIYATSHYIKDIDACFKNFAHYYIVKPSDGGMLVEALDKVISKLQEKKERPGKEDFVVRLTTPIES